MTQLNTRLPSPTVVQIRKDARRSGRAVDTIVTLAVVMLLRKKMAEREKLYNQLPAKTRGRKVKDQ